MAEDWLPPENFDLKQENTGPGAEPVGNLRSALTSPEPVLGSYDDALMGRDEQGRFMRGQSGNPTGRPRGSRNKEIVLVEQMFERFGGVLANKAVKMALDGNMAAMRLCVSRITAPRRHRASEFVLPPLRSAADLAPAVAEIAAAAAEGTLTTGEAAELTQIVDAFGRALAAADVEARLQRLESVNGLAR